MTAAAAATTVTSALTAINTPIVTGSLGVATAACLRGAEKHLVTSCNWSTVRLVNLLAFGIQFYAASQPGRLDGAYTSKHNPKLAEALSLRRGGTLLSPSGWAFSIWGPIFIGEFIMVLVSLTQASNPTLQAASGGFIAAQIFQTLWAATFRPKYYGDDKNIAAPWLSSAMLTGIAWSLSRSHALVSLAKVSKGYYLLHVLPLTLHFGWTTAAALVNWNGNAAIVAKRSETMAVAGVVSVVAASLVGVYVTVSRSAPLFGAVISWALSACATGMTTRLMERDRLTKSSWFQRSKDEIKSRKGFYGAALQKWLCMAGATISGAAAVWAAIQPANVAP